MGYPWPVLDWLRAPTHDVVAAADAYRQILAARPGQPGWLERCRFDNPSRRCVICGRPLNPEQRLTCGLDCAEEEYGEK